LVPTLLDKSPIGNYHFERSKVIATFSEAMNKSSVRIAVSSKVVISVIGTISWSGNIATFTPWPTLRGHTDYTVTVTGKDLAGNAITTTWTFSTAMVGKMSGTVLDKNGDPVVNATVTLKNVTIAAQNMNHLLVLTMYNDVGDMMTTTTDANGNYTFYDVFIGNYTLTISKDGYKTVSSTVSMTMQVVDSAGMTADEIVLTSDDSNDQTTLLMIVAAIAVIAVLLVVVFFFMGRRKK
jgi:hypothetical protein